VKVNSELSDLVIPTRGLRQEDPLYPYLFLFVAEGLTTALQDAISRREMKICRRAYGISHLLFAMTVSSSCRQMPRKRLLSSQPYKI
jgi:hypothetical protein